MPSAALLYILAAPVPTNSDGENNTSSFGLIAVIVGVVLVIGLFAFNYSRRKK